MGQLNIQADSVTQLTGVGGNPNQAHVFEQKEIDAVNIAISAHRPLLIRGDPGTGKTQLARAVAKKLGWALISSTIDAKAEATDLLYHFDAVGRLAKAQIMGAVKKTEAEVESILADINFVRPRSVWWAFDWSSAFAQAKALKVEAPVQHDGGDHKLGRVLLIDEIDKADSDLPNGLLEAFGSGRFQVPGREDPVVNTENPNSPLLIIVTTNEERTLPDAFLRRCMVLHLTLPSKQEPFEQLLIKRAKQHFPEMSDEGNETIMKDAAAILFEDRGVYEKRSLSKPGQAEYIDLLRAIFSLGKTVEDRSKLLSELKKYAYEKHPEETR